LFNQIVFNPHMPRSEPSFTPSKILTFWIRA
jgi:hypothetical protein